MKYSSLTLIQKKRICQERQERLSKGQTPTLRDLALWAKEEFKLDNPPGKATMSRIVGQAAKLTEIPDKKITKRSRDRNGKNHAVDVALYEWVCNQHAARNNVNADSIRTKAKQLQSLANEQLASDENFDLKFSDGWLRNFKVRWGLPIYRSQREKEDADLEGMDMELPEIQRLLSEYHPKDVFNADECGLFYEMAPDKTIARSRNKSEERLTLMLCCNGDGSEKVELMAIGKLARPRAFKKKTVQQLGFNYHANSKAWMTHRLFYGWLERFQGYIEKTPGRKVILLIDSCSAHGSTETFPDLPNVTVLFLPSNTASQVQPLNAGIIASLKLRYRSLQIERARDLMDENVRYIYKMDVLTAVRFLKRVWDELPADFISKCWKLTRLLGSRSGEGTAPLPALCNDVDVEVSEQLSQLVSKRSRMSIQELLNPAGEDECIQQVSDDHLVSAILQTIRDAGETEAVEEGKKASIWEKDEDLSLPSVEDQLHALAIVKRIAVAAGEHDLTFLNCIRKMQNSLRLEKMRSTK